MQKVSVDQIIVNNLKRLMAESPDLDSQSKIATRSGVSQSTVGRVLRCEVSPTIETVSDIAKAFGLTLFDLINPGLFNKASGAVQIPVAPRLNKEEEELLRIYQAVPNSGRHAILATAHRELEGAGTKFKGNGGGEERKVP